MCLLLTSQCLWLTSLCLLLTSLCAIAYLSVSIAYISVSMAERFEDKTNKSDEDKKMLFVLKFVFFVLRRFFAVMGTLGELSQNPPRFLSDTGSLGTLGGFGFCRLYRKRVTSGTLGGFSVVLPGCVVSSNKTGGFNKKLKVFF